GYTSTCLGLEGIPSVAEEIMIARDIMLTEYSGSRLHIAHISTRKGVELVRQAKAQGIAVTAEVTPHHIALTEESVRSFDTNTKVRPPLRTGEDVEALLEGLRDGTIDAIASDHSPHAWEEKASEYIYAPFGVIGLETALGISVGELVHKKVLDIAGLITKYAINPYRILGLPYPAIMKGHLANLSIFDLDAEWKFDPARSLSKSSNSPFVGRRLKGKPFAVINNRQYFRSIL
ncbi:MAG: amidohydrolase family protein, partial [Calditrichaeota bacterium]|nr:amidohydrolase family protein [Calditrichota bacterium]